MAISETQVNDDGYTYNPDAQKQQAPTGGSDIILMPGVYQFNATMAGEARNRETGEPIVRTDDRGNEWPLYTITRVEVTLPADEGGAFGVFHDVDSKPTNYGKESNPYVSDAARVLAAIDAEAARSAGNFSEIAKVLGEKMSAGPFLFSAATGLEGTDTVWAKAQVKKLGANPDKAEVRKIWKDAKMSTKAFQISKGKFATSAKSPYGNVVKAKTVLRTFIPSDAENVEYGEGKFAPRN